MIDSSEVKVKSLQKALEILNCFAEKQPLGVTEISEKLGLYKSNVHNILTTYKAMEYLEQDEETGKYYLGSSIFPLCRALGDSFSITKIAIPYMQEIVKKGGEIVYLAIPHEDEVIYLEAIYPSESIHPVRSLLGERAKMYCTSVGKSMMAYLPEDEVERYLSKELIALTDYTITDKALLKEELAEIRRNGYAFDNMEFEFGIKCVGVPIFNRHGVVEAGISVSGPSLRIEEKRKSGLTDVVKKYAAEIEKRL